MAKIILAVSSSASIYKSLDLVSWLKKQNHEVRCILTKEAKKLINPKLFEALSGYDDLSSTPMQHIELARNADLMVCIPTTANTLSKLALGIADDVITSTFLYMKTKTILYCSMNPTMWEAPQIQNNVQKLRNNNIIVEPPVEGLVACGDKGVGKLKDIENIKKDIDQLLQKRMDFNGKKILISSGGSIEYIDPVRIISNLSSGKMGACLAEGSMLRGASVTYLHQNNAIIPRNIGIIQKQSYQTTDELTQSTHQLFSHCDILFMVAAPCDYKPIHPKTSKIKSNEKNLLIEFEKNKDILQSLNKTHQFIVGFSAETDHLESHAIKKMKRKKMDVIIANKISKKKNDVYGINGDYTDFLIIDKNEKVLFNSTKPISKKEAAEIILNEIIKIY